MKNIVLSATIIAAFTAGQVLPTLAQLKPWSLAQPTALISVPDEFAHDPVFLRTCVQARQSYIASVLEHLEKQRKQVQRELTIQQSWNAGTDIAADDPTRKRLRDLEFTTEELKEQQAQLMGLEAQLSNVEGPLELLNSPDWLIEARVQARL